jgi:DNA-binding transcriptional regulator YiaG
MGSEQMHQLMHHAHARALVSLNLHRRHLNESQRAMVAAKIATMRQGERTDLPSIDGRLSQPQAATLLNVSKPTVERASKVVKHGDKKLIADVESGEVTVSAAAKIATMQSGARTDLRSIDLRSQTQAALERKPAGNGRCQTGDDAKGRRQRQSTHWWQSVN